MARKPNLLFIFSDEQRPDTLGCYGNRRIRTPNIDALGDESAVFENAYVTQSVCTPSRSSIMTGLYPHTNGCIGNNIALRHDTPTIAEMVSPDYVRGYCGKWHLGDEVIAQHGFDHWVSIDDLYRRHYSQEAYKTQTSSYHRFLTDQGLAPNQVKHGYEMFSRDMAANLEEPLTKAAFVGREAARFILERAQDPFVLYVNFLEPHMPFSGPLNDLYDPMDIPVGATFRRPPPEDASWRHRLLAAYYSGRCYEGHDLTSEAGWRRILANYWGLCTMVDNAVGTILQALADSGAADNTIVVYTSDHGDMMGDHNILGKCTQYEEAIEVPLIMRVPWLGNARRQVGGRFSHIDLVPTLLELLGEPIPQHLEGQSRAGVLRGDESLIDNDVFVEWNTTAGLSTREPLLGKSPEEIRETIACQPWRTIVNQDGWKLNLSPGDQCELYDLTADPYEQVNLFEDAAQRGRRRDLADQLRSWQEHTRDNVVLPEL
jgi:arylsulfatase A-like enzyme